MGKSSRNENRAKAKVIQNRSSHQSVWQYRPRHVLLASSTLVVVAIVATIVFSGSKNPSFSGSRLGVPKGTQLFAEVNKQHVSGTVQYDRTPPAGGDHNATWLNCGVYNYAVQNENAVHDLEHGAVWITYRPSLSPTEVNKLVSFVESHYVGVQKYLTLSPYAGIPSPIVATAWGAQLDLQRSTDPRLLQFVTHFARGDQGGEPGAPCTGGIGIPIG